MGTVYQGIEHKDFIEYRGIKYANANRWKAPELFEETREIVKADTFGKKAWQIEDNGEFYNKEFYDDPAFNPEMNEDCLYLNIWAPKNAHMAPVVIWIHGGAFDHGHASEKEFDGAAFAKKGIVFVSIQYRVGVFGFLAHPWLEKESGFTGNYGVLDQIAAIEWVRKHISEFGGNPDDITLMGQSAGAMSVQTLVGSPLIKDKISKAILQSGVSYKGGLQQDITISEQKKIGELFAQIMKVDTLEDLRSKSPEELMEGYLKLREEMAKRGVEFLFLVPTIDGTVVPESSDLLIEKGLIADIPYMAGSTKNDIFADEKNTVLLKSSVDFSRKLKELNRKPAYVYYFSHDLPGDDAGAFHSSELWYTMGTLNRSWRPFTKKDYDLSEQMITYWTNFIKNGNPNGYGVPEWINSGREEDVRVLD